MKNGQRWIGYFSDLSEDAVQDGQVMASDKLNTGIDDCENTDTTVPGGEVLFCIQLLIVVDDCERC